MSPGDRAGTLSGKYKPPSLFQNFLFENVENAVNIRDESNF